MSSISLFQVSSVFFTGVLTGLSPCIYPMVPISLAHFSKVDGPQKTSRVLLYLIGQVSGLTCLALLAVKLGEVFGFTAQTPWVQMGFGIVLLLLAIFLFKGQLPSIFNRWNNTSILNSPTCSNGPETPSISRSFVMGVTASLIASPCSSPALGGVLSTISQTGSLSVGGGLIFIYSLGLTGPFALLGLGVVNLKKLPKSSRVVPYAHKALVILLLAQGVWMIVRGVQSM